MFELLIAKSAYLKHFGSFTVKPVTSLFSVLPDFQFLKVLLLKIVLVETEEVWYGSAL